MHKSRNIVYVFIVLKLFYNFGYGFPKGPGWPACVTLEPNLSIHGASQTSASPYELALSSLSYFANTSEITVTIQKISNGVTGFKGFIVKAVDADDNEVGNFQETSESQPMCNFGSHAGQKTNSIKDSVSLKWIPPPNPVGNIFFKGTILQNVIIHWKNVPSPLLTGSGNPIKRNIPVLGSTNFNFDLSKCGKEMGCLRLPSNCDSETNCFGIITWKDSNEYYDFEFSVNGKYRSIALGFSKDKIMSDDSIFGCYVDNYFSNFTARNYYSPKNPTNNIFSKIVVHKPIPNSVILEEASFNANEKLRCKIKRKKFIANQESEYFDIRNGNPYYVMVSFSDFSVDWPKYEGLYYHSKAKSISDTPISITTDVDLELNFPAESTPKPSERESRISLDECGTAKSCFRVPENCQPESKCKFSVTWKKSNDDFYEIELSASAGSEYIAFALSDDELMKEDSVIICYKGDGDLPNVSHYYIDERHATPQKVGNEGITVLETSYKATEGVFCKIRRQIEVNNAKIYPMTDGQKYHLFFATGQTTGDQINYHSVRILTKDKMTLNEIGNFGGEEKSETLMKAHGILMALAWILFAVFGIFNARYFKTLYSGKLLGKDTWFTLHRTGMVFGVVTTIAGFVLILIDLDGKIVENAKKLHNAHPIVGIIVLILTLINPIMAVFRPNPGSSQRPFFNHAHRFVGIAALILGIINVIIGLRLDRVGLVKNDLWVSWVALGFFCFIIFLGLVLDFVPFCVTDEEIKKVNAYSLEPIGRRPEDSESASHFAKFLKAFCLVLLVLASLTMTIIIIVKVV